MSNLNNPHNPSPSQELVEQHQMGSNPDYGITTPTLVSPPKVNTGILNQENV